MLLIASLFCFLPLFADAGGVFNFPKIPKPPPKYQPTPDKVSIARPKQPKTNCPSPLLGTLCPATTTSYSYYQTTQYATTSSDLCATTDTACLFCGQALATIMDLPPQATLPSDLAWYLCYEYSDLQRTSVLWAPYRFDGAFGQCTKWAATAAPSLLPWYQDKVNFCYREQNIWGALSMDNSPATLITVNANVATATGTYTTGTYSTGTLATTAVGTSSRGTAAPASSTGSSSSGSQNAGSRELVTSYCALVIAGFLAGLWVL